jgi:hypothetical protein
VRRQLEKVPERGNEGDGEGDKEEEEDPGPLEPGALRDEGPPKASARRLLKSFLSTLVGWRAGKTLPRGSRDYYAARESLGEEMRAFRRDTMPRLIERAVLADRLRPAPNEQCEFAKLIGATLRPDNGHESSHATIRPVYGSSALARQQRRASSYQELAPGDAPAYGSRRTVQVRWRAPTHPIPCPRPDNA